MKIFFKTFFVIFLFVSFWGSKVFADDSKFKVGEHYNTIEANELSKQQEIVEFFSFYCGHCYMFRSIWNDIKNNYPNVLFKQIPVSFLGGANGPLSQRAYAVADTMGIAESFSNELFTQIHKMRKAELTEESLADIAAYVGGDKNKFSELLSSFISMSQMAEYNAEVDKAGIRGVPTVMINHKYIILKAEKDEMNDLINYLLTKDNLPTK